VTSEHLLGHLTTFEARDGRLLSMHVAQAVRLQRSDGQSAALRDWCRALQLALERRVDGESDIYYFELYAVPTDSTAKFYATLCGIKRRGAY